MTRILTWLLLLISMLPAWGQTLGTITGEVTDATGAVVPGATVKIRNTNTNAAREVVSNAEGLYSVPSLQPGVYDTLGTRVRLTAAGRIEGLDGSHLAGSAATMAACMRHLRSLGLLSEDDLWRVGLENPLRILGLDMDSTILEPLPDFVF